MRCPATRARICAVMYPTSDPTYSTEIGTSCSITGATLTRGGACAAPDLSPQPETVAASNAASRPGQRGENAFISVVCITHLRGDVQRACRVNGARASDVTDERAF